MVPSATLRVFQPLDGFEHDEQLHWERYLLHGRRPTGHARFAERETGAGVGLLAPMEGEHAEVLVVDGVTYVSPERMRMRVLQAIVAFRESEPFETWERFVSTKTARVARRQLARHRRRDPQAVPFVHQSPWHVPIRWFALFRPDERELREEAKGFRLRYRTTTRRAMRRAENAIPVLRRSDLGPIAEHLLDLHQWMAGFDPRSIVQLDYGDLCDFMTWDELDDDRSVADVQAALDALGVHEYAAAADVYQGVLGRWDEVRSRELLN